jgi:hypothetical protein
MNHNGKEMHRDFDISLTCGMVGLNFEGEFDFSQFTTVEIENLYHKACDFKMELTEELNKRPGYKDL